MAKESCPGKIGNFCDLYSRLYEWMVLAKIGGIVVY